MTAEMKFKKFPKVRGLGLIEFKRWQKDTTEKQQKQLEEAKEEVNRIKKGGVKGFRHMSLKEQDIYFYGYWEGFIKAKKEDLESLK